MVYKFIFLFFQAFVSSIDDYLEYLEAKSPKDVDGFPIDPDYDRVHYLYEFFKDSVQILESQAAEFEPPVSVDTNETESNHFNYLNYEKEDFDKDFESC